MRRELEALERGAFDIVVLGCGIHGVSVARDAALRGLSVAAIDMGDVSGETSHNSLKTIHGGIRYLQHLNFKRARESIDEQRFLLRTAPHLVRPMPFLMPTYGHGTRGPLAMLAGLCLYELIGIDRNRHLGGSSRLARGRILSARECLRRAPDVDPEDLSGAALWSDAQVVHADRAAIEILQHAVDHGAVAANHVGADELVFEGRRVVGVRATDRLSGRALEVRGRVVVNATGPWAARLLQRGRGGRVALDVPLTRSMNIVTRLPPREFAIALKSERPSDSVVGSTKRLFFCVPWNGRSVFGTTHVPHDAGEVRSGRVESCEIEAFVNELNAACPSLGLTLDDVLYCYQGLTPASDEVGARSHESRVIDHAQAEGIGGLVSVIGIKWTTARLIAERVVDLVARRLGNTARCRTRDVAIPDNSDLSYRTAGLDGEALRRYCDAHVDRTMAVRLTDMLLRRNDDLAAGYMSVTELGTIARHMRDRLGWSNERCREELDALVDRWLPGTIRTQLNHEDIWH